MPLDNADIAIISREVMENLYKPATALSVCRDRSAEIVGGGDSLRVDNYNSNWNVQAVNYTRDIAYDDVDDGTWSLPLDRRRSVEARVIDEVLREKPYDAMVSIARQMANAFSLDRDSNIVAKHNAASYTSSGNNQNRFTIPAITISGTAGSGEFKWDTATARQTFIDNLVNVTTYALKAAWPQGAAMYMLCPPDIKAQLIKYFVIDQKVFGTGGINDSAFLEAYMERVLGFRIIVNYSIDGDATKAGTNEFNSYFGIVGETCHYAEQFSVMETLRDPDRFADLVRMFARYGAGVPDSAKIAKIDWTFTTS